MINVLLQDCCSNDINLMQQKMYISKVLTFNNLKFAVPSLWHAVSKIVEVCINAVCSDLGIMQGQLYSQL